MMTVLTRVDDGKGAKLARIKGADSGHDDAWRKHANVNKVDTWSRAFGGGTGVPTRCDRCSQILVRQDRHTTDESTTIPQYGGVVNTDSYCFFQYVFKVGPILYAVPYLFRREVR